MLHLRSRSLLSTFDSEFLSFASRNLCWNFDEFPVDSVRSPTKSHSNSFSCLNLTSIDDDRNTLWTPSAARSTTSKATSVLKPFSSNLIFPVIPFASNCQRGWNERSKIDDFTDSLQVMRKGRAVLPRLLCFTSQWSDVQWILFDKLTQSASEEKQWIVDQCCWRLADNDKWSKWWRDVVQLTLNDRSLGTRGGLISRFWLSKNSSTAGSSRPKNWRLVIFTSV